MDTFLQQLSKWHYLSYNILSLLISYTLPNMKTHSMEILKTVRAVIKLFLQKLWTSSYSRYWFWRYFQEWIKFYNLFQSIFRFAKNSDNMEQSWQQDGIRRAKNNKNQKCFYSFTSPSVTCVIDFIMLSFLLTSSLIFL